MLADLALGGGAVLPAPEDCIYVFDEAHHLADKTQNHFASSARIQGTLQWFDNINNVLGTATQRFARPANLVGLSTNVASETTALGDIFTDLSQALSILPFEPRDEERELYRFPLGDVPVSIAELCTAALPGMQRLCDGIERFHELLSDAVAGNQDWEKAFEAEDWLLPVGQLQGRALATLNLLQDYAQGVEQGHRCARWINRNQYDVEMVSAPIEPGHILSEVLWQRCYGCVCTSATLTALGSFQRFWSARGCRQIPQQPASPVRLTTQRLRHFMCRRCSLTPETLMRTATKSRACCQNLLSRERSALVLFTSWRQLNAVVKALPEDLAEGLLVQGDGSKQALIAEHRRRIDEGEASHLVGVASFSEGLDLPGTTVAMLSSSNCLSRYRMTPLTKPLLNGLRPRAGMPFTKYQYQMRHSSLCRPVAG